ncbi:bifunctional glutamate--cysteine ligase GshA/glutathione synthetase GshB [Rubritalea marina]|uniref:bifunctional glutamate--cysteine ligase GshA/glutathione synthetase GshB n=1 Tax=Rubritalea marina TaxID=361055 RepID=UPI000361AD91|nr:bifunctional glutamate--cysteine ligase GshA/glutathione synthetase GshB [Rubritalea marina]
MSMQLSRLSESSKQLLFDAMFGLEKEHVRVDMDGKLARTAHPAAFGDKLDNPYITVDFAESQLELITPPLESTHEALGFLETLQDVVVEHLDGELLWPQSMPPELPESAEEIQIADFGDEGKDLSAYRDFLADAYGRKRQMIAGVHVNMSFSEPLLRAWFDDFAGLDEDYEGFRERVYLRALRTMLKQRWMMLALLGNSPVMHLSYAEVCGDFPVLGAELCGNDRSVSIRASLCGYRNNEEFVLDYSSVASLEQTLGELVDHGRLHSAKELYSPVRLKKSPETGRITHLEFRMLDLDPSVKVGVRESSLHLLHAWMIQGVFSEEGADLSVEAQLRATANQYACACCGLHGGLKDVDGREYGEGEAQAELVAMLQRLLELTQLNPTQGYAYRESLELYQSWLEMERHPLREHVRDQSHAQGFIAYHRDLAMEYRRESLEHGFGFKGMGAVELSTQLLLRDAVRRGVRFEWMDRAENFVRLSQGGHEEYVQQATKTSRDRYSAILMMENKLVTKRVLAAAGMLVPQGEVYADLMHALSGFGSFSGIPIVVKPKTTNFGLGITIYPEGANSQQYEEALRCAFAEDSEVLVEHFVEGKEYRFFVIDGKVHGVLHRVPANVIGDGVASIGHLVERKNLDPMRGVGYTRPLEKIAQGREEEIFLAQQGMDFESIPGKGQQVFLRENSNISTGGDSIDYTDEMHPTYLALAAQAAEVMGVAIAGVDMMVHDHAAAANGMNYSIIEMNFNPAIHIHCYPHLGTNRQLNSKLLDFLGY